MKKLLSVISIVLLILVMCSVNTLATEASNETDGEKASNEIQQIGAVNNTNKSTNKASNTNKATNKTVEREDNEVESNVVGSTNKTNSNKTNTNTNKTNTSNYNSTGSSKLPYAGTGTTSVVLVALAFAGSAVYAYKKVTDYNL